MPDTYAQFSLEDAKRIADMVRWFESMQAPKGGGVGPKRHRDIKQRDTVKWAKITSATLKSTHRWWYGGIEVSYDKASVSWVAVTNGVVFDDADTAGRPIVNACEGFNPTADGIMGNGIDTTLTTTVDVTLLSLRGNPVVPVRPLYVNGELSVWVAAIPNAVDVECRA